MAQILQVVAIVLACAGVLCLAVWLLQVARSGRWRDPLADSPLTARGPDLLAFCVVTLIYFGVPVVACYLIEMALSQPEEQAPGMPGTLSWHLSQLCSLLGAVTAGVVMVVLLSRARQPGLRPRVGLGKGVLAALFGLLVLLPVVLAQLNAGRIIWSWFHARGEPPLHPTLVSLQQGGLSPLALVELLVGAIVAAPIVEELFFRGVLLQALYHHLRHKWVAIAVAGLAFGVLHGQPQDKLPMVTMGVLLGYMRVRTGALWPCMVVHLLFNGMMVTFTILAPQMAGS
jgi:membrane protease YdiL (CAAX protease family)